MSSTLIVFTCSLLGPAFAPGLPFLAASLFAFAALNSVVDVAMNTQGLALQRLMGRPVLSRLHAMHSLGGVLGAGVGALAARFGAVRVFRAGGILSGAGFGGALLVDPPAAGLVGFGLLGAGIANALPLAIGAGGSAPGQTPATAAARVSTLGYLGSFVGPALVGALASLSGLPMALALPALLVLATAFGARAVSRAG